MIALIKVDKLEENIFLIVTRQDLQYKVVLINYEKLPVLKIGAYNPYNDSDYNHIVYLQGQKILWSEICNRIKLL